MNSPDTWISGAQAIAIITLAVRLFWGAATKEDLRGVREDLREVRDRIHNHVEKHSQGVGLPPQQTDTAAVVQGAVEGVLNARGRLTDPT